MLTPTARPIRMPRLAALAVVLALVAVLPACVPNTCTAYELPASEPPPLVEVFSSPDLQLTGVAVSRDARVFVNFPRWGGPYAMGVGEVMPDGSLHPWPNEHWNRFASDPRAALPNEPAEPSLAADRFVCVQSVVVDADDRLWALDAASPSLAGVVRIGGGPKLVRFDLRGVVDPARSARAYRFDQTIAPDQSYLNDVRIDTRTATAYITDSGLGAIIVVDLNTGAARRLLDAHASTRADPALVPVIAGRELRFASGEHAGAVPQVHSDGIALDSSGQWLYWQALTSKRLHRIRTAALRDPSLSPSQLAAAVEDLGETVVTDGMTIDADHTIFFTALERDAIIVRTKDARLVEFVRDLRLAWPDSLAIAPARAGPRDQRWLYITTSQIHRGPWFAGDGAKPSDPYRVFRVPLR